MKGHVVGCQLFSDVARLNRAGRRKKCDKGKDFKEPYESAGPACHPPRAAEGA